MGTEVLRPQDCLIERIRVAPSVFHRRRSCNGNGNGNPKFRKPVKKRFNNPTEPSISKRSSSCEDFRTKQNNHHLVTGQVTILRRGQSFDAKVKGKSVDDLILCGTQRSGPGPGPKLVPKQKRVGEGDLKSPVVAGIWSDVYAGSAFSLSPSPSSLPLPSFFNKKQVSKIVDDSATRDLRRLLRLD